MTSAIGMIIMSGILCAEFFLAAGEKTRLSWPYGDLNPGNYLAKVSLVAFLAIFLNVAKTSLRVVAASALITCFVVSALFLTGERVNLIIVVSSLALISVIWKN